MIKVEKAQLYLGFESQSFRSKNLSFLNYRLNVLIFCYISFKSSKNLRTIRVLPSANFSQQRQIQSTVDNCFEAASSFRLHSNLLSSNNFMRRSRHAQWFKSWRREKKMHYFWTEGQTMKKCWPVATVSFLFCSCIKISDHSAPI